jgi:hypothetical protein
MADPSLDTQGSVGDKPCIVTVDTKAYVNVARPNITTGWPEREPNQRYALLRYLQKPSTSWRQPDPGPQPTKNLGIFANITNKFILGLDILRAYGMSVDLGRQTLRLAEEEVLLWSPGLPAW